MHAFFNLLVILFQFVSKRTGLTYAELNIVVYCGLVPLGWLGLVVMRQRRYRPLLLGGTLGLIGWIWRLRRPGSTGQSFYDFNIRLLELLGRASGLGYVGVSLLMGVLIPAVAAILLLLVPRRWALPLWATFGGLLAAYFWLGSRWV